MHPSMPQPCPTPRLRRRDDLRAGARRIVRLLPGLGVVALATALAAGFSGASGAPLTLAALLTGLALSFRGIDARLQPGIVLACGPFLRISIVLIGVRVTFAQIANIGLTPLAIIGAIVSATILAGVWAARRFGLSTAFGALAGGAVAICGASAALALSAVLGERRLARTDLTTLLIGISIFSAAAMVAYPLVAAGLGLTDDQVGFVLGASIHDVAQSIGAGFSFSASAGETALVVKLTRVAFLVPALLVYSLIFSAGDEGNRRFRHFPWFVLGFLLMVGANSAGWIPAAAAGYCQSLSEGMLVSAVCASAMQSRLKDIARTGWRPMTVILIASATALALSLLTALLAL